MLDADLTEIGCFRRIGTVWYMSLHRHVLFFCLVNDRQVCLSRKLVVDFHEIHSFPFISSDQFTALLSAFHVNRWNGRAAHNALCGCAETRTY